MYKKIRLYAIKNKMNRNWHNINSKVQLGEDVLETERMHAATTTPIAAADEAAISGI